MTRRLIIGVGNPFRHDDGVGIAAIERLRLCGLHDTDLVEESGEPVALVQRWTGRETVVLVDAVDSGGPAGTLHRFECTKGLWGDVAPAAAVSTHGLGVLEAVELGRVLDRLPDRLVLLGVEAADVSDGVGLSPPVAAAVEALVGELTAPAPAQPAGESAR
ncbi:MAG: hydrogenase maturation protease [Acidimicrobiales bacterium]